jgi:hypothetical protein
MRRVMMSDSATLSAGVSEGMKGSAIRWLYPVLIALQIAGVIIFYSKAIPFYRELTADVSGYSPGTETLRWSLSSAALIQIAYWMRFYLHPATPRATDPLVGHVVRFLARLVFVLPSSVFSFVFLNNNLRGRMPVMRYLLVLVALFSIYCFTLELERFGKVDRRKERTPR